MSTPLPFAPAALDVALMFRHRKFEVRPRRADCAEVVVGELWKIEIGEDCPLCFTFLDLEGTWISGWVPVTHAKPILRPFAQLVDALPDGTVAIRALADMLDCDVSPEGADSFDFYSDGEKRFTLWDDWLWTTHFVIGHLPQRRVSGYDQQLPPGHICDQLRAWGFAVSIPATSYVLAS